MNQRPRFHVAAAASILLATAVGGCSKSPEVPASPPWASPAAANVADIDVTQHVKSALLQSPSLKAAEITVITSKGDVRLSGALGSQAQIDEVVRIAATAEGAHTIHNEMTIRQ
jgi:hyperosmotically inducible protein